MTEKHLSDWLNQAGEKTLPTGRAHLFWINTDASNADLTKAFKGYLKRRATDTKGKPVARIAKNSSAKTWAQKKLIPYIDLILWRKWTGHAVSEAMLVSLLYDEEFDPENFDRTRLVPIIREYKRLFGRPQAWNLMSHGKGYGWLYDTN